MPESDVLELSSTAFNDAANCLKRYEYRWVDGIIPRPQDVPHAMRRGTWIHRALELRDNGLEWFPEIERMGDWLLEHEVPVEAVEKLHEETVALVEDYIGYWSGHERDDPNAPYRTVGTEVPVRYEVVPGKVIKATIDRIVTDRKGRQWIWERKSTGEIPTSAWRVVDPQTAMQYLACRRLQSYSNIVGVIFDYVLTEPGPQVRVKKDGRLYAGLEDKQVTSRRFDAASHEIRNLWVPASAMKKPVDMHEDPEAYIHAMRMRMVNDGRWFQRYPVYRPDDNLAETLRDIGMTMHNILAARKFGHYARALNVMTCRRFCRYNDLCVTEYTNGRVSNVIRQENFVRETPELRAEGRSLDGRQ